MTVLKRQTVIERLKVRLGNDGSGEGKGLRRTINPEDSSAEWNIGDNPIFVGRGERPYPPTDIFPHVIIFPFDSFLERDSENHPYEERMSVGIEVWVKGSYTDAHEFGNKVLRRIQEAVEIDKRFREMDTNGNIVNKTEICSLYTCTDRSVLEFKKGIIYIAAGYDFSFFEDFLGKRSPM